MVRQRKKSWDEKVLLVRGSLTRSKNNENFAHDFYENLFFLNPKIQHYFEKTDFDHQRKALIAGLEYILDFLDHSNQNARTQVLRISQSHSKMNMNIYPHDYYYWIEALVKTVKKHDVSWYDDLAYYWREVIFYPVSFIISQYFHSDKL